MTPDQGNVLLQIARGALDEALGGQAQPLFDHGWLHQPGATFVTLRRERSLRGCIGSLEPVRPLADDVRRNALAAAFRDPRFLALAAGELPEVRVEVTVLSPLERVACQSEAEALAALRPGQDGVVLEWGGRRGTFIPQMWDELPDPQTFLRSLKRKAGFPGDFWHPSVRVWRFTAEKFEEER